MKSKPRDPRTELEKLDEYILDLTVRQIGANYAEFEQLHIEIMELQKKRRELDEHNGRKD